MINYCFRLYAVIAILLLSVLSASGQEKCGAPAYLEMQQKRIPSLADKQEFEQWIHLKQNLNNKNSKSQSLRKLVYRLPVVIHVIHKGEPIGTGTNIPEAQILSQLQTINDDFRRKNEAQINLLPPEFRALAADAEIEFVLAKQDPEGLPFNGITRTRGGRNTYRMQDDLELKDLIHWDPENYINIYAVDLAGDVIGYAQFPETDKLQGLELGKVSGRTDGVVIDYKYFGSGGSADPSSLGRTLTHELGHFFGLRHTWGDGGCEVDDFVNDTPLSSEDYDGYSNCNGRPTSCQGPDMFQNFLTYASDACMALFTSGQKDRMLVVLENSPRRKTLVNSYAKEEPVIVPNDAGIALFVINITDPCTKSFIPTVSVRNYGSTQINSFELSILQNGLVMYSRAFSDINLEYLEQISLQLDQIEVFAKGELSVEARVDNVNGTTDNKLFNNHQRTDLFVPYITRLPFLQDFETSLIPFYKVNPDYFLTWQLTKAPINGDPDNLAAFMNFYDYEKNQGTKDLLISPILDLEEASQAFLSFRYAYAQYNPADMDGLKVYVTTDCSGDPQNAVKIFDKMGSMLATATPTTDPFVPAGNEHWRTEQLDLSQFVGMENLQIIFAGVNDYGNNLYLDDIELFTEARKDNDIAIQSINYPSVVSCDTSPVPGIIFRNAGTAVVDKMELIYSLDKSPWKKIAYQDMNLSSLESMQLALPPYKSLKTGKHTIQVRITSVNGDFDENPVNDVGQKAFAINTALDSIPLRQRFTDAPPINHSWVNISPNPVLDGWNIRSHNTSGEPVDNAAVSEFFGQPKGQENWLVSPTLDLSGLEVAGVQFRHSYAPLSTASDILQVRVSTDCGKSWSNILYEKGGSELSARKTDREWTPRTPDDWDVSFVNLSEFAGLPEVRVAFVAISDGGNDIFLDNIEFFQSDVPIPLILPAENSMYVAPNPASYKLPPSLVFNLNEREDVLVMIYTIRGEKILEEVLPNILNQKITLNVEGWAPGMYFLRAKSKNLSETQRFVIVR